jgi:hypothetical protein
MLGAVAFLARDARGEEHIVGREAGSVQSQDLTVLADRQRDHRRSRV